MLTSETSRHHYSFGLEVRQQLADELEIAIRDEAFARVAPFALRRLVLVEVALVGLHA